MADSSFGLKIELEGEREFKRAISDINREVRVLGTELKLAATSFDSTDKSAAALTARSAGLVREIDAQKAKITELERALANASWGYPAVVDAGLGGIGVLPGGCSLWVREGDLLRNIGVRPPSW